MTLSPSHRITTVIMGCLLFLAAELVAPRIAHAVPVFARKYATSCQTCHVAYPKLTPFGEAFRRNGWRFPGGEDEDAQVSEPVALGQQAHKKVWPSAVWPSDLPAIAPIAVQLGADLAYKPNGEPKAGFGGLGGRAVVNFVSTLGESFAAWAAFAVGAAPSGNDDSLEITEAELERIFLVYKAFEEPYLNIRLGRFEIGAIPFTMHRTLGPGPWYTTTPVRDNPFGLDPAHLGIEATGVVAGGRLNYAAGFVSGVGHQTHVPRDAYARLGYKLGGMRLDGIGGATESDPWRETSLQIGTFGYAGIAPIGNGVNAAQDDRFYIAGADLNGSWRDLNVMVAYSIGRNNHASLAEPFENIESWHLFTQADYVVFPWLIPSLRYERRSIAGETADRVSPSIYILIYANVRGLLQASIERQDTGGFEFSQGLVSLRAAF